MGSSDGKGSTLSPHHVVKLLQLKADKVMMWPGLPVGCIPPLAGICEGTSPGSGLSPSLLLGLAARALLPWGRSRSTWKCKKKRVQFPLQEFRDGFEGRHIKQSFGIAFAGVMLRGGI